MDKGHAEAACLQDLGDRNPGHPGQCYRHCWTAHRITSHVKLCVLALRIERAAEIRVGDTWRNLRFALEEVKAVRYRVHGITMVQSTRLTAPMTAYLKKLGVKPPPRVLSIESSSAAL